MSFKYFDVGEKVKGDYYGVAFTGSVKDRRPHTMNDSVLFYVELDEPLRMPDFMNPDGDYRSSLMMSYPFKDSSLSPL